MKRIKILTTLTFICSALCIALLTGCDDNNEPAPQDSTDYKLQYTLRVITDNDNPVGREKIVGIAQERLATKGITLTQKSESVWGYEAAYPNEWDKALAEYNMLDEYDAIPDDLEDTPGLLFYGTIEEDVRITAGSKISKRDYDQEHYDMPTPDQYRYTINRDAWEVKYFELDETIPPLYTQDYSSCQAEVKINGGNERRRALFSAQGVSVYKANSGVEIEAVIRYHTEGNVIKATLATLNGNSVNMPITLTNID